MATGIRKNSNGLYENRFTVDGKRYSVYGKTIKECRAKEAEKREAVKNGLALRGGNISFKNYSAQWLSNIHDTVRQSTFHTYTGSVKKICATKINGKRFGDFHLKEITPQDIRDMLGEIAKENTIETANNSRGIAAMIFRYACTDRIIIWNPCEGVKTLKSTQQPKSTTIHRALTREEMASFMLAAQDSFYFPLYETLLHTGMRIGEAGALKRSDIDTKNGVISVTKTLQTAENGSITISNEPKTKRSNRKIPIFAETIQAIRKQQELNDYIRGYKLLSTDEIIFKSKRGGLLNEKSVTNDMQEICRRAGIEVFTPHAFRHTFCTFGLESGMQPKVMQSILGHSTLQMTLNIYAHAFDDTQAEQMKKIDFGSEDAKWNIM